MARKLEGTYFETCSCEFMCQCDATFDHGASYDRGRVVLVFNIVTGEVEGTDVGGLVVAAIAHAPKVMTEGNRRLDMFVDEKASDEQSERLPRVFAFGIEYEGKSGLSTSRFAWAA